MRKDYLFNSADGLENRIANGLNANSLCVNKTVKPEEEMQMSWIPTNKVAGDRFVSQNLQADLDVAHRHGFGDGEEFITSVNPDAKDQRMFLNQRKRISNQSRGVNEFHLNGTGEPSAKKHCTGDVKSYQDCDSMEGIETCPLKPEPVQAFHPFSKHVSFPASRLNTDFVSLTDVDQHNRVVANERLYNFRCLNSQLGSHLI